LELRLHSGFFESCAGAPDAGGNRRSSKGAPQELIMTSKIISIMALRLNIETNGITHEFSQSENVLTVTLAAGEMLVLKP
jgi:hypothetical protein